MAFSHPLFPPSQTPPCVPSGERTLAGGTGRTGTHSPSETAGDAPPSSLAGRTSGRSRDGCLARREPGVPIPVLPGSSPREVLEPIAYSHPGTLGRRSPGHHCIYSTAAMRGSTLVEVIDILSARAEGIAGCGAELRRVTGLARAIPQAQRPQPRGPRPSPTAQGSRRRPLLAAGALLALGIGDARGAGAFSSLPPGSMDASVPWAPSAFGGSSGSPTDRVALPPCPDLISLEDAMEELELGPNGGLMYCMEYLLDNMDWLKDELDKYDEDEYIIFDCPGQVRAAGPAACSRPPANRSPRPPCRIGYRSARSCPAL